MTETLKVFVIFQEVPESIRFYELVVDKATADRLHSWNYHFINSMQTDDEVADAISDFFYNEDGSFRHEEVSLPLEGRLFDLVVTTGLLC